MSSELQSEPEAKRKFLQANFGAGILEEKEKTDSERLSEQVFSIPLIFKEILKNLRKKDLLRTSFVSKYWNFFSREVLREFKICMASVLYSDSCMNLKMLNDLLLTSDQVPFNGISITGPWTKESASVPHMCIPPADRSEIMSNILSKINMKHLDLREYLGYCSTFSNCLTLEIIREILRKATSLEQLLLEPHYFPSEPTLSEFIGLDLQGHWLPNVQILKFGSDSVGSDSTRRIIKELVEASPKLQALFGNIYAKDLHFILPLKVTRAVKYFDFTPKINSLGNYEAFSLENPKLLKIIFSSKNISEWPKSLQNKVCIILKQLLESSKNSLKEVACDHPDLTLITSKWNIPALRTVTRLSLGYISYSGRQNPNPSLGNIEWAKYFPSLEFVNADGACRYNFGGNNEIEFGTGDYFFESNVQFVCETVTRISWCSPFREFAAEIIGMFGKIFPNVKEFNLPGFDDVTPILKVLYLAWPNLKTLTLSFEIYNFGYNYDSLFLGVTEEEATYLLKNVQDLKSLEIVSIKPCILNLRKLKKLEIDFIHYDNICLQNQDDDVVLSRLTGECVFSRIPGLTVKICQSNCENSPNCRFAMNHIKPYVKHLTWFGR